MSNLKRARFFLESLCLRFGFLIIPRLPRSAILFLSKLAGSAAYFGSRKLRRIAAANLKVAFGAHKTEDELRSIARQSFRCAALSMMDFLWFTRNTAAKLAKHVSIDASYSDPLRRSSVIGVTAHFGNWELVSIAAASLRVRHTAVFAELKNPYVTPYLQKYRSMDGVETIRKQGAIRGLLKALRRGQSVALLLDQNVLPADGGLFIEFFGLPAPISNAAGLLSERTGTPVLICFCMQLQNGDYRVYAHPPIEPDRAERLNSEDHAAAATRRIAEALEGEIAGHPEQWLWMYKRWKFIAPGRKREGYPFYSRRA